MIFHTPVFSQVSGGELGEERTTDAHSSSTATSGTVSASSNSVNLYPWEAFDQDPAGLNVNYSWHTSSGNTTGWIQYSFSSTVQINTFRIRNVPTAQIARSPKDYTVEISMNGIDWTTAKTITNNPMVQDWQTLYSLDVIQQSNYARINVSSNNGDASYLAIQEIEFNYQEVL